MPINCIRCKAMIPQADITARMTAKDKNGNFFCARCTVDLASQMGVKLGGPKGTQPPAGPPGQTVVLNRMQVQQQLQQQQKPPSTRVETATHHPGTRPGTGPVPRVASGPVRRPGSAPRTARATTRPISTLASRGGTTRRMPPQPPPEEEIYEDEAPIPPPPPRKNPKVVALGSVAAVVVIAVIFAIVMVSKSSGQREKARLFQEAKTALEKLEDCMRERPYAFDEQKKLAADFERKAALVPQYAKTAPEKLKEIEEAIKKAEGYQRAAKELDALAPDAEDAKNAGRLAKRLEEIKPRLNPNDAKVRARYDALYQKVAQHHVLGLFNAAKELDAGNHDAILAKLDEAYQAAIEAGGSLDYLVNDILVEDDRVANLKYTDAFVDSVPWVDLMTAEWRGQWKKSPPPQALDAQTGGAEWTLEGKEVPGVSFGVYYIGSEKGWRDFVLETEVVIESFGFSLFGRCGRPEKPVRYDLRAKPDAGISQGETYKVTFTVQGLKGKVEISDVGMDKATVNPMGSPTGGVGFVLEPGNKVRVKSCRIKILRTHAK